MPAPTTWDEACGDIVERYSRSTCPLKADISNIRNSVNRMAHWVTSFKTPPPELFGSVAREAIGHLKHAQNWDELGMTELLIRKQHDYGHDNINGFGFTGLVVRLSDKVARLTNLTNKTADPLNESVLDTWLDIVGYCVIAEMLFAETFNLNLKEQQ